MLPLSVMEFIDIILGGLLLYGLGKGLWKGLIAELAALVSLFIGIFIAIKFSGYVGTMLAGHMENPKYISMTAFAITFIGVVVGIILLAKVFTKLAGATGLGLVNRLLGGLFGLIKMVLILSISLNFFLKLNSTNAFAERKPSMSLFSSTLCLVFLTSSFLCWKIGLKSIKNSFY